MADSLYPEHDKVKALGGANQVVGNFIEWLAENGYTICEFNPSRFCGDGEYFATRKGTEQLLFDHFEIDRTKFHAEKDRMLDDLRDGSGARAS